MGTVIEIKRYPRSEWEEIEMGVGDVVVIDYTGKGRDPQEYAEQLLGWAIETIVPEIPTVFLESRGEVELIFDVRTEGNQSAREKWAEMGDDWRAEHVSTL
jgi:hypothetical protein